MKLSDKFWEMLGLYVLLPLWVIAAWILELLDKIPYRIEKKYKNHHRK